jgi:hypothetical protein
VALPSARAFLVAGALLSAAAAVGGAAAARSQDAIRAGAEAAYPATNISFRLDPRNPSNLNAVVFDAPNAAQFESI